MDIRQIEYYLEICKAGSLSKAANNLFITQQALGKSMDLLEDEVGMPLLIRSSHGITLTKYGESLYEKSLEFIEHYNSLENSIKNLQSNFKNTISIGFFNGLWDQLGYNYIEDFITKHDDLDIHLYSYQDNSEGRCGFNKDVDILFSTNEIYSPQLKEYYHSKHKLHIIVNKNHPLLSKEEVTLDDLKNEYIITTNSEYESQHKLTMLLSDNNITPKAILGDIENELTYYFLNHYNAVTFYAGPTEILPDSFRKLEVKGLNVDWNFYIYVRKTSIDESINELADTIISIRERYAKKN